MRLLYFIPQSLYITVYLLNSLRLQLLQTHHHLSGDVFLIVKLTYIPSYVHSVDISNCDWKGKVILTTFNFLKCGSPHVYC